jgi:hypothetical protein
VFGNKKTVREGLEPGAKRHALANEYLLGLLRRSAPFGLVFLIVAVLVVGVEEFILPRLDTSSIQFVIVRLFIRVADEVLAAIAALLLVTLAWERWNHEYIEETLKSALVGFLADDSENVQRALQVISVERRKSMILSVYKSLIGSLANHLYDANIEPYLVDPPVRYNFESSMTLREMWLSVDQLKVMQEIGMYDEGDWEDGMNGRWRSQSHHELEQTVYYEKPVLFRATERISICFAMEIETFKVLLRQEGVFWREVIHIDYPTDGLLAADPNTTLVNFVRDILNLRVDVVFGRTSRERPVQWDVSLQTSESGGEFIQVTLAVLPTDSKGLRIHCTLPQRKSEQWSHVIFIDPTFVNSIMFAHDRYTHTVGYVDFLHGKSLSDARVTRTDEVIIIKPEGCVVPVSGVTFLWRPCTTG